MLLIQNATVYTMAVGKREILEHTDILCDQGKIVAIGQNLKGDEVIDGTGLVVLPGIVDAHNHTGIHAESGSDGNEMTNPNTAQLDIKYGIDFSSQEFLTMLTAGITTSCITPGSGNVVCGYALAAKNAGDDIETRIIRHPVALKAAMGINPKGMYAGKNMRPMSRMGIAEVLREYFLDVKDYMKEQQEGKNPAYNLALEHGIAVLKKEIPLKVHCYQHDMLTVLAVAKEFDFYATIDHASGVSDFYDDIMDEHIKGIIYGPFPEPLWPGEGCKSDPYALKELSERGKLCAVMTDGPLSGAAKIIVSQIGEVVRSGMDPYEALRMITINAARIIGVEDRVGSIEVGKDADFAIYDGVAGKDAMANCCYTIIDGKIVYRWR